MGAELATTTKPAEGDDRVQPFMLEASGLRGRMVRLGLVLDEILGRHPYPHPVALLLGEAVVLGAVLASGLKYEGIFSLQLNGDGPVSMLVMDMTSAGKLRAYARYKDADGLDADSNELRLASLVGKGRLAFTVDQGPDTERYQGIVELVGETLSECVQHYFRQSEQIDTGICAAVDKTDRGWRGGGIAIQRLPDQSPVPVGSEHEDDWRRAMVLMGSAQQNELANADIDPNTLLYRLFHEDGVRVFDPLPLAFECRCSRDRVGRALASLPPDDLAELAEDGTASVTCEFCNTTREFQLGDVAEFRSNDQS